MVGLLLFLLQSAPVVYGESLIREFRTFDLERCYLRVEPHDSGARVRCRLTVKALRAGPVRFLLSSDVADLAGARVEDGGFAPLVRALAPQAEGIPQLLVFPRMEAGQRAVLEVSYDWRPGGGLGLARGGFLQTHIGSFWAPLMADERFEAVVEVLTSGEAVAAGRKERIEGGWRFTSELDAQAVPVVAGPFEVHRAGRVELYLPPGLDADHERILADTEASLAKLESWFGNRESEVFRVVVDPRRRPLPSYCGGNFVVLARSARPSTLRPESWRSHVAHECAHAWWGHGVGMPVVGRGGNFLREGLAQWCGIAVADDPVLWKRHVAAYLSTADLRSGAGGVFANEPTLRDATYLDPPRIAYWRGALVLRRVERRLGREEFLSRLRALYAERRGAFVDLDAFAARMGAEDELSYYAESTRLPDYALEEVDPAGSAVVRCLDEKAPQKSIPCIVTTAGGTRTVVVELSGGRGTLRWEGTATRLEIDPERILLDPAHANNVWGE